MTKVEAQKIISAFCNGVEYPFRHGDFNQCDQKELNYYADLLDKAVKREIVVDMRAENNNLYCPTCDEFIALRGIYEVFPWKYCPSCGQRVAYPELSEEDKGE